MDFSAVGFDKARRLAENRGVVVEWVTADVTRHEPPASAFDLVVVLYLHLPSADIAAALAHATDALAPGGTLLVIGDDSTNLTDGYGGPQNPDVLYGPDEVVAALGDLTIKRAERVRRPVVADDHTVDAIDVWCGHTAQPAELAHRDWCAPLAGTESPRAVRRAQRRPAVASHRGVRRASCQ